MSELHIFFAFWALHAFSFLWGTCATMSCGRLSALQVEFPRHPGRSLCVSTAGSSDIFNASAHGWLPHRPHMTKFSASQPLSVLDRTIPFMMHMAHPRYTKISLPAILDVYHTNDAGAMNSVHPHFPLCKEPLQHWVHPPSPW